MNIFLDYHSRTPIYEQIKNEIILAVCRGELKENEQLPSLRQLSSQLGLNINTIKRAFQELDNQGIIYSVAGKGIFVSEHVLQNNDYCRQAAEEVKAAVVNAKAVGASKEMLIEIIESIYK